LKTRKPITNTNCHPIGSVAPDGGPVTTAINFPPNIKTISLRIILPIKSLMIFVLKADHIFALHTDKRKPADSNRPSGREKGEPILFAITSN
jgi:hypothetical protein